tara:strand:+ start:446 stop:748 length:303 start_codon:yes stop_codon:yes gene_type:complete
MKSKENAVYVAGASNTPTYDVRLDQFEINELSQLIRLGKKEILKDFQTHKNMEDKDLEVSNGYLGIFPEDRVIEKFTNLDRLEEVLKTGRRVFESATSKR